MAGILTKKMEEMINDPASEKVLGTVTPEGDPHAVFKGSLRVNGSGQLEHYELIESSVTNRNLIYSLWFGKAVTVTVKRGKESIQIKARPARVLTAGREFEEVYSKLREDGRDLDLSGIWLLTPEEVRTQTFETRWAEEDAAHPILRHLDRLTV